jgi:hypothetical protein
LAAKLASQVHGRFISKFVRKTALRLRSQQPF